MKHRPPRQRRSLWVMVAEPRVVTVLVAVVYTFVCLAGVASWNLPPTTSEVTLGPWLTSVWSALLILGGAGGVVGALPGWWYLERAAILASATGLGMYAVGIFHVALRGEPAPGRLLVAALVCALITSLAIRWVRITGATLDPARAIPSPNAKTL